MVHPLLFALAGVPGHDPVPAGAPWAPKPWPGPALPRQYLSPERAPVRVVAPGMTEHLPALRAGLAGRYDVQDEAGRGGMAVVYRARDLRHHRDVALKVLRPGLLGAAGAQRFLREIRVVAGLVHPHILPLHDSGELPGSPSLLYFVMPFVTGETLRSQLSRNGPLPINRAVRIARQVASALDYAHRHNVVHRDVKPENILLHEGEALVTDFGVARLVCEVGQVEATDTAPGLAIGTPAYMSPEQAGGEPVDGRADQYGLACVLYEALAGTPPFTGPAHSVIMRHLGDPPPALRRLRPDVPIAIERVVARALAKEPAARYPTAAAFADALGTPLAGVTPASSAPLDRPSIAVLPFVNASGDPDGDYLSDGLTDELINTLAQVPGLWVAARSATYAARGADGDARWIGSLLGVGSVLEGTVRHHGGELRVTARLTDTREGRVLWTDRYDRPAGDLLAMQEDIARTIVRTLRAGPLTSPGQESPRRRTANALAYSLYLKGRHSWNKRTVEGVHEAIRYFEAAIAADPGYAAAVSGLADAHALGVDYRAMPVREGMALARREAERALALDDSLAEAHTSLAWVTFIHDWDWPRAAHHFHRALELDPRYATARQWHSWYLAAMGRPHEAVTEARLAAELDPASVSIRRSLGWIYHYARDPQAGIDDLRRAVVMNPETAETSVILAQRLLTAGEHGDAELALKEALALEPDSTSALATLARLRAAEGRRPEAESLRDRLLDLARERYVSPTDLVRLHLGLGEYPEALAMLERAWEERRGFLVYLKVDPVLDPLREFPRFIDLVRRMRFP